VQQRVPQPMRLSPRRHAKIRLLTCGNDRHRPLRLEFASRGTVTPTTDTNGLGHWDTGMDACGASSEASDSAGHFGRALQAGGHLGGRRG
jgi:hypothetical protein